MTRKGMRARVLDPSSSSSSKDMDFPGLVLAILSFSLDRRSETSIAICGNGVERLWEG